MLIQKTLVSFAFGLAIVVASSLPGSSQFSGELTKQSRQTVQRLPNGNYFYGKSRLPAQADVNYLVFRKTGNRVVGISYIYIGEGYCFTGTANGNTINNVSREYVELGSGSPTQIRRGNPINLATFNKLNFNQVPSNSNAKRRLPECIRLFSNR